MTLTAHDNYDALNAHSARQGPASTMESNPSNRTLCAFTEYYRELLGFLTAKLHRPHDAADLVQETFARLLALEDSNAFLQPRAFLYRIAHNLATGSHRKIYVRHRFLIFLSDLEKAPSYAPLPDHLLEGRPGSRAMGPFS
ncbi:MAG: hypothetical protein LZF62_40034 [Nitrospira sp.]|nr:MAG: hypothetical protein LZF62_40034 [Nitrospira sp.]